LQLPYHLLAAHEQFKMSLLVRSLALIELLGMGRARAAWTDVVGVGVVLGALGVQIVASFGGRVPLRSDTSCG
jgi:hypothetical protein